jgi:asparagine synthase (glutamine-hydrolysing)
MCGINGIILRRSKQDPKLEQKIKRMQQCTLHRGPDQSSYKLFKYAAIGVNRLAIIAPNDTTLLHSDSLKRRFAVLNGEIVNYRELNMQLPGNRRLKSDSAIIIPMIKKYGTDFVSKLAGMFSIAVYDAEQNTLQLWRDPLGIKPLYYYCSDDLVIFSSEIKAIYAALEEPPDLDFAALDHILSYRFNSGRSTVFAGIKKVLPGETITFAGNKEVHEKYWSLKSSKSNFTKEPSIEEFRELFSTVISQNTRSDVAGGFFSSGGLDSSMVTTLALKNDSLYTQPISIKFKPRPVEDEKYAELLEKFLKTKFEWVEISNELARQTLEEIIPYLDEPRENPIHIGTYLMAKRAKALGIKSILTGDGSDEFFLGYERQANWFNNPEPVQTYPVLNWTMTPEEAKELYKAEVFDQIKPMVDGNNKPIQTFQNIEQALFFERTERLPEYHNMRLDRMTMAHGVEAKVPFLDHRIVEYSLAVPTNTLFGETGKEWLRNVAEPWLPEAILNRPKALFPSLPDQWLSGKGSQWSADILLNPSAKINNLIKSDTLERYIDEHNNKVRQRGKLLWALVTLELWLTRNTLNV